MRVFTAVVIVLSLIHDGISHPDGAPSSSCATMKTRHHGIHPSACSSEYIILPQRYDYTDGDSILVTVRSTSPDTTFRGVLLLVKDANSTIVGNWTTDDPLLHNVSCGGVTHNSNVDKTIVQATWHASPGLIGNLSIKATIVQNFSTVYVDCYNVTLTSRVNNYTTSTMNPLTSVTLNTTNAPLTSSSPGNTTVTPSPTAKVGVNVSWTFDAGNITTVRMSVTNLKSAQWAAFGLSLGESMGETHVFICRRLANDTVDANRYVNPDGHSHSVLAGPGQGGTFTVQRQGFVSGVVFCQFTLSNFENQVEGHLNDIPKLSQSIPYHPLFAIGQLDDSNELRKHAKDSRTAQSRLVQLNRAENIVYNIKPPEPDDQPNFVKAHGIIMVFTWMVIVSTGVLISRHFKNSWPTTMICGKAAWFAVHRVLMIVASILTLVAFLFIFTYNQGSWVDEGWTKEFVHSITGVIVLGLAFFQPFIALFRCETDSQYRFIFNYLHAFVGFLAFILSTATLFLATFFTSIFPNSTGWIIMVVWSSWVVTIFIAFESIKLYFRHKNSSSSSNSLNVNNAQSDIVGELITAATPLLTTRIGKNNEKAFNPLEQRLKSILLVLHVLVTIGLSLTLVYLIWQSE